MLTVADAVARRLSAVAADKARAEAAAQAWAKKRAGKLPAQWRKKAFGEWSERRAVSERAGNTWLRELTDRMREGAGLPMDADDAQIRDAAREAAAGMYACAMEFGSSLKGVRRACEDSCRRWGIKPPDDGVSDQGAIARMFSSDWWVRRLRAAHGRRIESAAVGLGYVSRFAGCYVSDVNLYRRRDQKARNRKAMEAAELENQYGDIFTLAELADRTNANPRIRRAELMTRIAGFEACAAGLGHVAEFWTVTCPSRYHARRSADGGPNQRYQDGLTPRDAQAHLVGTWAKCRAALARRGVRAYGFRIAEPHHDGCPHWHLLLFMPADAVERARAVVVEYFLMKHEPDEPGARENRVKFVSIDPARAGAAGYVAKYVAKSIDGYAMETDLLGNPAIQAAERVEAWAATWGIRQFQQIGGAPVGVWRELRRMQGDEDLTDTAHEARQAANAGVGKWSAGWAKYNEIQGGPMTKRRDLRLSVAYTPEGEKWDAKEACMVPAENVYGEPCAAGVWGVRDNVRGIAWASRRYRWRSVASSDRAGLAIAAAKARKAAAAAAGTVGAGEASRAAKAADWARKRKGSGVGKGEARAAWTRVNNCTGVGVGSDTNGRHGGRAGGIEGARRGRKDAQYVPGVDRGAVERAGRGAGGDPARSVVHRRNGGGGGQWPMM